MSVRQARAAGLEALAVATAVLQRVRGEDPDAGFWEAADLQWWWRMPRRSDAVEQLFWLDEVGPVGAAVLTDWGRAWACDPIVVPSARSALLETVWTGAVEAVDALGLNAVDVLARDDDAELLSLLANSGFEAQEDRSWVAWMDAPARRAPTPLPRGFALVDRAGEPATPHPMRRRNGDEVEARLRQCSLYDGELDLAIRALDGRLAGYALFWFDPTTLVGLVEPMRVEDEYQRRGLGRALLTEGLERLARRGARRLKVGFGTEIARRLYLGAGFRAGPRATSYRWTRRG